MDCAKTTARRNEKHYSFGIWCNLYQRFDCIQISHRCHIHWARAHKFITMKVSLWTEREMISYLLVRGWHIQFMHNIITKYQNRYSFIIFQLIICIYISHTYKCIYALYHDLKIYNIYALSLLLVRDRTIVQYNTKCNMHQNNTLIKESHPCEYCSLGCTTQICGINLHR